MRFRQTKVCAAALCALGGSMMGTTVPAWGQQQAQRIEITGSNIRRTDAETASPVQVVTREEIERTGKQSVQEILRSLSVDSNGTIPTAFSAGFASGSAAVSLRGLGVNSTLVLVNGRRMTTYGLADDGTRNFVDLNSLPLEAVERVEVLKDGASAIYGADAVGGVINIILRKNYTGASAGGSFGQSSRSDGRTVRAFGVLGLGDLDADKYNVFLSLEGSKQKKIIAKDRGFIGASDLRPQGYFDTTNGAVRPWIGAGPTSNSPYGVTRPVPGNSGQRVNLIPCDASEKDATTGLCRYNAFANGEVQPEIDRFNLYSRATFQLTPSLTAFGEVGFFNTKTKSSAGLGANNDGGVYQPNDPFNPLVVHGNPITMTLPAAHPDNTFGVDRALFFRPPEFERGQHTDNKVYRLIGGLQGSTAGWDWEAGLGYIKSKLKNENFGYIRYDVMQAALNNGTYRITRPSLTSPAPSDPAVLAAISPTLQNDPTSSVKLIDLKATRDIATLPGGPMGLAVGSEVRWEAANTPPVPFTDTAEIVGLGYSAFSQRRRVAAVYAEINAPVTKWLEVNPAVRYDRYSDWGGSTTPKIGFKLKPIDQVALRGTYAEAFRAPGPAETGGSSFGFTGFGILSQGDPKLQPEKSKSYTLGLVVEPVPGTSVTVDFWSVKRRNEIIPADPNSIIPAGQCTASCDGLDDQDQPDGSVDLRNQKVAGRKPNTFLYYDAAGGLTVTGFFENSNRTKTNGVDLELRHRMNLGSVGRLTGQLNWTHVNKLERTGVDGVTLDYAGTHGPLSQSSGSGSPKDKLTLSLSLDQTDWTVSGALNYTGKIRMVDHKGELSDTDGSTISNSNTGLSYPDPGTGRYDCGVFDPEGNVWGGNCKLPSFTTFDLFARWSPMKNLDINFSIQNLFDRKAPYDPYLTLTYGQNYNQAYHQAGAVGRFWTIGAKYTF